MAGLWRLSFCVIALGLLTASSAQAFGGRLGGWSAPPTTTYHYYYAVPSAIWGVPYSYCPPMMTPLPRVIPVPDARPTTAPPSSTPEPPLQKQTSNDPRMPVIVTSQSSGSFVPNNAPLAKDRCRVGFWNLSGREVTLVIDGQARTLAKDRSVTLDLERQFSWQVEGRPQHVERVREGQATLELVIRQ